MKLAALVFLGLITTAIAYWLFFLLLTKFLGDVGDAGMPISIFAITPLALLISSFPIGYFSYCEIENKSSLLLMAPALYLEFVLLCQAVTEFLLDAFFGLTSPGVLLLQGILFAIGIGLYWYLVSATGVFLGYFLRERFAKWRYEEQ